MYRLVSPYGSNHTSTMYSPKTDNMAQKVEEKANEMLQEGYELITMSITGTAKAILVFKK